MNSKKDIIARVKRGAPKDCWLWTGTLDKDGYGRVSFKGRYHRAHRLVFELLGFMLNPEDYLMHSCDVRACCNPHHLKRGTHLENVADMNAKGRHHNSPNAAGLTSADVARVRDVIKSSDCSFRAIARYFNVDSHVVLRIHDGLYRGSQS